jgi:hypothetical protein
LEDPVSVDPLLGDSLFLDGSTTTTRHFRVFFPIFAFTVTVPVATPFRTAAFAFLHSMTTTALFDELHLIVLFFAPLTFS